MIEIIEPALFFMSLRDNIKLRCLPFQLQEAQFHGGSLNR